MWSWNSHICTALLESAVRTLWSPNLGTLSPEPLRLRFLWYMKWDWKQLALHVLAYCKLNTIIDFKCWLDGEIRPRETNIDDRVREHLTLDQQWQFEDEVCEMQFILEFWNSRGASYGAFGANRAQKAPRAQMRIALKSGPTTSSRQGIWVCGKLTNNMFATLMTITHPVCCPPPYPPHPIPEKEQHEKKKWMLQ